MTEESRRPAITDALAEAAEEVRRDGVHELTTPGVIAPGVIPIAREPRWLPAPAVWAPRAERLDLELADRRVAMRRSADSDRRGWWQVAEPLELPAGTDYAFVVDAVGPPLPDPRSSWQPSGVHGPSRTVDHEAFPWTDTGWTAPPLEDAIVYELHVGTFTGEGTFDSAIARLDELASLGVTHVELMPVAEFAGLRGWGYDGVDLFAPHHAYGGPDGLKRLVDATHGRGLAVLVDVVYNHLGPAGNYLPRFGPYVTDRHRVIWGDAVNFDGPGSDEVRRFVIDNARMWLRDYHADGLRLDAVHAIVDTSAVHILEELASAAHDLASEIDRRLVIVGESDLNDPRLVRPRDAGGYGLDAQWSDDFHHAIHVALTGERAAYYADFHGLPDLAAALSSGYVYTGQYSAARDRRHGRSPAGIPATRFLGYDQSHDQVGNRALGERLSQLVGTDALEVAAALVVLSPFVPMLFMGEEWAASTPFFYFTDHEPELGEAVRRGRHEEFAAFGWPEDRFADPQSPETFERSKLDWSERGAPPHDRVLSWYRDLVHARREIPALSDGRFPDVRHDEAEGWLVADYGPAILACNLATAPRSVPLGRPGWSLRLLSRTASAAGQRSSLERGAADGRVLLPPMTAALFVEKSTTAAEPVPERRRKDVNG